jgi:anthranilate synthase component 2
LKVLVLDNYDSFTFNLVQYLGHLGADATVARNDEMSTDQVESLAPDAVVISPGPGRPEDAGISVSLVEWCARTDTRLLGVCLGHQAIAEAFGGSIVPAQTLMHGKTSEVHHVGEGIFRGISDPFVAMRYHSLAVERASLPDELEVSAWTTDDVVMGVRHRQHAIEGVQFHPESILTEEGMKLLRNFVGC